MWHSDPIQSYLHGVEIAGLASELRSDLTLLRPWGSAELWAETVFVSICHSTNWDKLHAAIEAARATRPQLLEPTHLSILSESDFQYLTGLPSPEISADSQRRQAMLRQLGREAVETQFIKFLEAMEPSGAALAGDGGAYAALTKLSAFSMDPLQKKSRVLVHQWITAGALKIPDAENVAPAIDYHLIRLYLRSNRIHPRSSRTLNRFREGRPVSDRELHGIRKAVEDAMLYTAAGAHLSIAELNHHEWQVARSFCVRSGARCDGPQLPEKPVDQPLAVLATIKGGCPLRNVCRGASELRFRELVEPKSGSDFY